MNGPSTPIVNVSSSTTGASLPHGSAAISGHEGDREPRGLPERGDGCREHHEPAEYRLRDEERPGRAAELALPVGRHPRPHEPRAQERDALLAKRGAEHPVFLAALRERGRPVAELRGEGRAVVVQHRGRGLPAVARDEAPQRHRHRGEVGRPAGADRVRPLRHRVVVDEPCAQLEAVAVGGPLCEQELVEVASVVRAERHMVSFARDHLAAPCQPSSSATASSAGTDPIVVRNTVSRATISAVS